MENYYCAETDGLGAVGRNGKLVDAAMMRHATNVLRWAPTAEVLILSGAHSVTSIRPSLRRNE